MFRISYRQKPSHCTVHTHNRTQTISSLKCMYRISYRPYTQPLHTQSINLMRIRGTASGKKQFNNKPVLPHRARTLSEFKTKVFYLFFLHKLVSKNLSTSNRIRYSDLMTITQLTKKNKNQSINQFQCCGAGADFLLVGAESRSQPGSCWIF